MQNKKNQKAKLQVEDSAGEVQELGFVEYEEAQIRQMYNIFVSVCQQIREDSYGVEQMDAK